MPSKETWDTYNEQLFTNRTRGGVPRAWMKVAHETRKLHAPLTWGEECFWKDYDHIHFPHFTHARESAPGAVFFIQNERNGERGIWTQTKPGRYLRQYFGDILTEKQIAYYADWQNNGQTPESPWTKYELSFAKTQTAIARAYINGPMSCMDGRKFKTLRAHPTRAYAAGDLAVACLIGEPPINQKNRAKTVVARCLVWPDRQVASRVYPTPDAWEKDGFESEHDARQCHNALKEKLRAEGYTFHEEGSKSLDGARLLHIPLNTAPGSIIPLINGALVPFIDGRYFLRKAGDGLLTLSREEGYPTGGTNGVARLLHPYRCHHCRGDFPRNGLTYVRVSWIKAINQWLERNWCHNCAAAQAYQCSGDGCLYAEDVAYEFHGGKLYNARFLQEQAKQRAKEARQEARKQPVVDTEVPPARVARPPINAAISQGQERFLNIPRLQPDLYAVSYTQIVGRLGTRGFPVDARPAPLITGTGRITRTRVAAATIVPTHLVPEGGG